MSYNISKKEWIPIYTEVIISHGCYRTLFTSFPYMTCPNSTIKTDLEASRSRYEKGLELYKSGRVSIGSNGLFKVRVFMK